MAGILFSETGNDGDKMMVEMDEIPLCCLPFGEYSNWERARSEMVPMPKVDLIQLVRQMVVKGEHTNWVVFVGGIKFNCHSCLLRCASLRFRKYSKNNATEFSLDATLCPSDVFGTIYDWMASGARYNIVKRTNLLQLYIASVYLGIIVLYKQCILMVKNKEIFDEKASVSLYLEIVYYPIKQKYIHGLKKIVVKRLGRWFIPLVMSDDWLIMSYEAIKTVLESDNIVVDSEMMVFASAIRWLRFSDKRWNFCPELFKTVRYDIMTINQLVEILHTPEEICTKLRENTSYRKMILNTMMRKALTLYSEEYANSSDGEESNRERKWTFGVQIEHTLEESFLRFDEYLQGGLDFWNQDDNETKEQDTQIDDEFRDTQRRITHVPLEPPPGDLGGVTVGTQTEMTSADFETFTNIMRNRAVMAAAAAASAAAAVINQQNESLYPLDSTRHPFFVPFVAAPPELSSISRFSPCNNEQ